MNRTKDKIRTDSGKPEDIYQEVERGCGWRKIGGFYLVGKGMSVSCDALPIDLDPCKECGYEVPFSRTMQMIHSGYLRPKIEEKHKTPCEDKFLCPICKMNFGDKFALMIVSSRAYSPDSFVKEARDFGVSKRIRPDILPRDFKLGKTWVFLAHKEALRTKDSNPDILTEERKLGEYKRGLFYAFRPVRIEAVVGDNAPDTWVKELEQKGFVVVKVDHEDPKHQPVKKKKGKKREREDAD